MNHNQNNHHGHEQVSNKHSEHPENGDKNHETQDPLAAGVLYNQGIVISPALGAALMSLSTVIVSINARLLKID